MGYGTTTVTLDHAGGNAILAETTITGTVLYLYGADCLGELRDDEWLYYQHDGNRMVRQGTDAEGEVASTWLFDPDGTMLEGPDGPVSHLICGGVYDWSTGLIYRGGRYFDPNLGIWLALVPLVVVQSLRRRKRRRFPRHLALALLLVGMSFLLTGCPPTQEEMDKFAEDFLCTDEIPPDLKPEPHGKCEVEDVHDLPQIEVSDPSAGKGLNTFKMIIFCLKEGVDAESDCDCISSVTGYMRYRPGGNAPWEYRIYEPTPKPDDPQGGSLDYNGTNDEMRDDYPAGCYPGDKASRCSCDHEWIAMRDNPGIHAIENGAPADLAPGEYEVALQFWTGLVDVDEPEPPVEIVSWCFTPPPLIVP